MATASLCPVVPFPKLLANIDRKKRIRYARGKTIFSQGDRADYVYYNTQGIVLLTILSQTGKEGVLDIVGNDEIFGEACVLAPHHVREYSAIALVPTTVLCVDKMDLRIGIRRSTDFAEEFLRQLTFRNRKIQDHLTAHLFVSSEVRLARALKALAGSGDAAQVPRVSQSILAAIVGTTRSRVSCFLTKFRRMGIIDGSEGLRINTRMIDSFLREQDCPQI